jgi:adenylosuccinate lyase
LRIGTTAVKNWRSCRHRKTRGAQAGADRQAMHECLRQHSLRAWQAIREGHPNPLVDALAGDETVRRYLSSDDVRQIMSTGSYIGNAPEKARAMVNTLRGVLSR